MTIHNARIPATNDLAAEAEQITGAPDELAERLRELLDAGPPVAAPRESAEAAAARIRAAQLHTHEVALLRYWLANDFATARGWTATTTPLCAKEIERRSAGGNWHRPTREWPGSMFHRTFFRDADRRAAAMVAHPLAEAVEKEREAIEAWAAEHGLAITFPDYPSWQDPSRAVLAVFEPAATAEEVAPAKGIAENEIPSAPSTAPDLDAMLPLDLPAAGEARPNALEQEDASDLADEADTLPAEPSARRPIVPLDLEGVVPRDLTDEEDPGFEIVDPRELLVDDQYQRGLNAKSTALIRRIVANWSWARFKVPTCVRVDGRLHVVDGQHTAIAAASHPDLQAIPILVCAMPEVTDRASAFLSHATNRLQATPVQIHRAALTAGDKEAVALDAVCRAAGVELLPFPPSSGVDYAPGRTVAVVGIRRLIARRGAERTTEILSALADADLAPITGDHLRLAETLLSDEQYTGGIDAERLTLELRGLTARVHAEARELAIAQRLPAWRALAAVIYRNSTKPKPKARQRPAPASTRRGAGA